jgi:hypothetical protein
MCFTIPNDTVRIAAFVAPMVTDTVAVFSALAPTGMLMFKAEVRDSITGAPVATVAQTSVTSNPPYIVGNVGLETTRIVGQRGRVCYLRITVDTVGAPSSISFIPLQEISGDRLSDVLTPLADSLGKRNVAYSPRAAATVGVNPIEETMAPNPAVDRATVYFTVPVEDAQDVTQVRVCDVFGNDVTRCLASVLPAGPKAIVYDVGKLPSGSYFVTVEMRNHKQSRMLMVKR